MKRRRALAQTKEVAYRKARNGMTGKAADISPKEQRHYAKELLPPSERTWPL